MKGLFRIGWVGLLALLLVGSGTGFAPGGVSAAGEGPLVMVGGGLDSDNREVYEKIITLSGGPDARIGIVPTASADPYDSVEDYKADLVKFGAKDVQTVDITVDNGDRSAYDPAVSDLIRSCDALFFTGGDQSRVTEVLYEKNDSRTPALDAMWEIYRNGALMSGSSAGLAVMSDPMLTGGTSSDAMYHGTSDNLNGRGVTVGPGLGFFSDGLVDSHFDQRGRIGRLIRAAWDKGIPMGFGVEENTALVRENGKYEVVGEHGVTIIDLSKASLGNTAPFSLKNARLHYLEQGDRYIPAAGAFIINPGKTVTKGHETHTGAITSSAIFDPQESYGLITRLADSKEKKAVGSDYRRNEKSGVRLILSKDSQSKGYRGQVDGRQSFAATGFQLNVESFKDR